MSWAGCWVRGRSSRLVELGIDFITWRGFSIDWGMRSKRAL